MLRIRLTRTGKKHQPTYRIVVAEHSAPIKGKYIEIVGYYLPTRKPKVLEIDAEKVEHWISKGAQATDTVHNMLVDKGILTEKRNIKYAKAKLVKEKAANPEVAPVAEDVETAPVETPEAEVVAEPEVVVETPETAEKTDETPESTEEKKASEKSE